MCSQEDKKRRESSSASGLIPLTILKLLSKEPQYGYALAKSISKIFEEEIDKSVIYMALKRLEQKGYIKAEWEIVESGPARKVYVLTEEGKKALKRKLDCLVKLIRVCERILNL